MSNRKEIENKIQEWLKPYMGQKIDPDWLTKLILWELQGRPDKVDVDGIKWDVAFPDQKPQFTYTYTNPDADPEDVEYLKQNDLLKSDLQAANRRIATLENTVKDRTEHSDDMWSAMAGVIKILWEDENATDDHGYSSIEARARAVLRERDEKQAILDLIAKSHLRKTADHE